MPIAMGNPVADLVQLTALYLYFSGAEMAALFNDLLLDAGISPTDVRLLRHHTKPGIGGISLFDLWRDDREGFERYQSTQRRDQPVFRTGRYWASFVSPTPGTTVFTGLYEASYDGTRVVEWPCPYRGNAVGEGKPVDVFSTALRAELAEHIGRLHIEWDPASVRRWARYAANAPFPLAEAAEPTTIAAADLESLIGALGRLGFQQRHQTKKLICLQRGNLVVYVKRETTRFPLILHPSFMDVAAELSSLTDVQVGSPLRFYINSNLTEFPRYESGERVTTSRYGFALNCSPKRLADLVALLDRRVSIDTDEGPTRLVGTRDAPLTEREQLTAARVGQGNFRTALIAIWGSCPLASIDHLELLRASHIKPWAKSTNRERLDPYNGLLLSANVDALFDRGLISFEDDGTILISSLLGADNIRRLGLTNEVRLAGLKAEHAPYLEHHRTECFRP
jgi:hypothetical protein